MGNDIIAARLRLESGAAFFHLGLLSLCTVHLAIPSSSHYFHIYTVVVLLTRWRGVWPLVALIELWRVAMWTVLQTCLVFDSVQYGCVDNQSDLA